MMTIEVASKSNFSYLILMRIKILAGNDDDTLITNEQFSIANYDVLQYKQTA